MQTPLDFLKAHGDEHAKAVAERAGTTLDYFKQIAYRHSRPSPALAQRLAQESGGELDAAQMVFQELKTPGQRMRAQGEAA